MKNLSRKQKEKEELILKNASILFAEQGYFNTDILSIATKSNVGKGTIYNYFKNKEDIFLKVIQYQLNNSLDTILDKLKKITNIKLYIESYIEEALDYYVNNTYSFDILFQSNRTLFDKAMEIISETQSRYLSKFREQFSEDFEKISFIKNPEYVFLTVQAGIFAMVHEYRSGKNIKLSEIKTMLKSLYLNGLLSDIKN
ncbi:MAG: hypothetical protein CR982_01790 [Candidatus Cloacimonadota bacterium]|nr:MAG: hypothetical protein CR982_01790 [Candidatus Cloacimonadota bacterium]PIE77454.1 MAG: hypothetical protein CSA15_12910 [Candidatus Delongbacteria bacterium]